MPLEEKLLKLLFNIEGYYINNIVKTEKKLIIDIIKNTKSKCPICNNTNVQRYDSKEKLIYTASIFSTPIYCRFKVYRLSCKTCGIKTEKHYITEGKKRYFKGIEYEILKYTELLDNKSTSKLLGISESTIFRIDKCGLEKILPKYLENIPGTKSISVDEVSYKRRHKYATVITNHEESKVLWLEKDRKSEDLKRCYNKLHNKDKITNICLDFWPAYEKATNEELPNSKIIYDRFHLSRILNRYVESDRREYQNSLSDEEKKYIKRNYRWILLKRKNNLTKENTNELENMKIKNEPLYEIYLLKEKFLSIFSSEMLKEDAKVEILNWIDLIFKTNYRNLKNFAKSVIKRLGKILNWFDNKISNGLAEGINNVIKTLLKRAYGYKDFNYFRLKVLQKCGTLMNYATHTF